MSGRGGFGASRSGRYGATGPPATAGRGGAGDRSSASSSRSNAALLAQQRLRALMQNMPDENSEEYGPPSIVPPSAARAGRPSGPTPGSSGAGGAAGGVGGMRPRGMPSAPLDSPDSFGSGSERSGNYGRTENFYESGGSGRTRPDGGPMRQEVEGLRREAAKLKDDLDVMSEENEYLVDKLRMTEEELKETQARAHELEKQVAKMGEGISLEARLLNKKEQALKQKEAMLKQAKEQTKDVKEVEITSLRLELETQKEEAAAAMEEARLANEELRVIRAMTARLVLTPEEKEEVVLKRCWLARYWSLASRLGVYAEVAGPNAELWQKLAPLPFEVVMDAGRKAKEEEQGGGGGGEGNAASPGLSASSSDSNIESMFQVERALRDIASLKVEEGVLLAMAQHRRPALLRLQTGPAAEGPRMVESMDLSDEEVEDVRFKQNWLVFYWHRAKAHGIEADVAADRVLYWINRTNLKPTAHDAVDADRGLMELRKLGVEQQLWEISRKDLAAMGEEGAVGSPATSAS